MTVTQVNRYIAFRLKEDKKLKGILVSGEISNFRYYEASGHMYFTLKDKESSIKAVMFRSYASQMRFMPENGMSVIVKANVQVYEKDGLYQLYVSDMQPDGLGALHVAYEQRREKLEKEGIFDADHKKEIPAMPEKIGIVTSEEAAALQDMLNIISRRFPLAEITLFPTLVQGENAPASICRAIRYADSKGLDLIICGRGGGSFEDLMAFSDEAVARCFYSCNTPIISAVGHETDDSLSDFAADLRAPTPSAAAELAVPDINDIRTLLYNAGISMDRAISEKFGSCEGSLYVLKKRLEAMSPEKRLMLVSEKLNGIEKRLCDLYMININRSESLMAQKAAALDALSPLKTLSRGFSIVYKDEKPVNSADRLSAGDNVEIRFADGKVSADIKGKVG